MLCSFVDFSLAFGCFDCSTWTSDRHRNAAPSLMARFSLFVFVCGDTFWVSHSIIVLQRAIKHLLLVFRTSCSTLIMDAGEFSPLVCALSPSHRCRRRRGDIDRQKWTPTPQITIAHITCETIMQTIMPNGTTNDMKNYTDFNRLMFEKKSRTCCQISRDIMFSSWIDEKKKSVESQLTRMRHTDAHRWRNPDGWWQNLLDKYLVYI